MKSFIAILCGALAATATAGPAILLYGKGYYDKERVVLNVFADSTVQLRSFGIRLTYDPNVVGEPAVFANDALWFLSAQPGQRAVYTPLQQFENSVRIVGARFQGEAPGNGVQGQELLLATLVFPLVGSNLPTFQIDLAGPELYASFVTIDGTNMDEDVEGLGTLVLTMEELALDSDGDGIPDPVELGWFGNLTRATATSDSDGDGTPDIDEWIGGTDPKDPSSVTRLVLQMQPDGSRRLIWNARSGRVYDILRSTDLGAFVPIAEGLTEESATIVFDHAAFDRGFYRLRTKLPSVGH
jgi:hypothetical protein